MLLKLPFPLLLAPLPFVLYVLRRRGWRFLIPLTAFWVYTLALIHAVLFPIYLPQPGVGFDYASTREQLNHLLRYHGLNLVPFYFGSCWDLPRPCANGIFENILMTTPLGILCPLLRPLPARRIPLLALLVGLGTETAQLLVILLIGSNYRTVDINDTLLNALGVIIGYGLLQLAPKMVTILSPTRYTL